MPLVWCLSYIDEWYELACLLKHLSVTLVYKRVSLISREWSAFSLFTDSMTWHPHADPRGEGMHLYSSSGHPGPAAAQRKEGGKSGRNRPNKELKACRAEARAAFERAVTWLTFKTHADLTQHISPQSQWSFWPTLFQNAGWKAEGRRKGCWAKTKEMDEENYYSSCEHHSEWR